MQKHGKIQPNNPMHQQIYAEYQRYLGEVYDNDNTIHFYEYGMYCLLQFINIIGIHDIKNVTPDTIIGYLKESKPTRQREVLCELRGIFRYLNREDLTFAIAGIHAPRIKKIIPTLTEEELKKIETAIDNRSVTYRDAAIIIIGLSCGIRACDLIRLKLSDIDWNNETITFKQSKTGNQVILPLTITVGNAIARYVFEERPSTNEDILFLRALAPFVPLTDHASCHAIVRQVLKKGQGCKACICYAIMQHQLW